MTHDLINQVFTYNSVSLLVALASLLLGLAAVRIAKSSLSQAKQVAGRDHEEWRRRQWFDLYFKADDAYDAVERFRTDFPHLRREGEPIGYRTIPWNDVMLKIRTLHRIAMVFPPNAEVDALVSATDFSDTTYTISKEQELALFNAVQGIRDRAIVDTSVLESPATDAMQP